MGHTDTSAAGCPGPAKCLRKYSGEQIANYNAATDAATAARSTDASAETISTVPAVASRHVKHVSNNRPRQGAVVEKYPAAPTGRTSQPAIRANAANSSTVYLCAYPVRIVSPASRLMPIPAIAGDCAAAHATGAALGSHATSGCSCSSNDICCCNPTDATTGPSAAAAATGGSVAATTGTAAASGSAVHQRYATNAVDHVPMNIRWQHTAPERDRASTSATGASATGAP